ncbi:helix-turn-helix transcriptional regulator [Isoptericola chiayiensis]|nr:helix-turn-helix transcriptional regulator [Isoptericola chiayiensis]NOW00543.1 transcriptional regulator with XRE-family HTH domain [Isoptericola chiayiensis]
MDIRQDVKEFLTSRRARVTPADAGLPAGSNRRVPGLRRSEVAMLADMSVEYYARLERGNLAGVSDPVLESLARALQLDEAERSHLFDLAHTANRAAPTRPRRRGTARWVARPALQAALDAVTAGPAFVRNGRMDILAANRLGWAFYDDVLTGATGTPNLARFTFLDTEHAERFYPDWNLAADIVVAILRIEAGRDPHDKGLHDLVGELSTRSTEFRTRWGAHDVRHHGSGTKGFHHAVVGDLELAYEGMELTAEPGLSLTIYTAQAGSASEERLRLLASWAASQGWPGHPAVVPDPDPVERTTP